MQEVVFLSLGSLFSTKIILILEWLNRDEKSNQMNQNLFYYCEAYNIKMKYTYT